MKGKCSESVPTVVNRIKPHSRKCPYYSNDFEADKKAMKACGGLTKYIRNLRGVKDEEDLIESKKKRRPNMETDKSGVSPSTLEKCESGYEATSDAVPKRL
jgi:hypothetical protein